MHGSVEAWAARAAGEQFNLPLALVSLLAIVGLPWLAGRWYAGRVDRRDSPDAAEDVHRLRIAMTIVVSLLPAVGFFGALLTGAVHLLIYAWEQVFGTVGEETAVRVGIGFGAIVAIASTVATYRPLGRSYRRLREIGEDERKGWAKRGARAILVFLVPLTIWIAGRALIPDEWVDGRGAALILYAVLLFGIAMLTPLIIRLGVANRSLDGELRNRLLAVCRTSGVKVSDIRVLEARSNKTANAVVAGVWPFPNHVFLTDYLLDHFEEPEVEAVVAHEIGHAKEHHVAIKVGSTLVYLGMLLLVPLLVPLLEGAPGWLQVGFLIALPVFLLGWFFFLRGWISMRLEYRADDHAQRVVGTETMVRALDKLADLNMAKRRTGRLWNLVQQHPGIEQRIERLEAPTPS